MTTLTALVLFDAHNHLQDDWLRPHLDRVAADLAAAGVARVVVNGTCESDWPVVAALAARFSWVQPSFGLHPWDAGNASPRWRESLPRHLDAHPHAALGEIGLDGWILSHARPDDPRLAGLRRAPLAEQAEVFLWQLRLAAERNLPVSIHCLEAWGPLLAALRESPRPARGFLLHAYGGSAEMAAHFASLGAYFSFNGNFLPRFPRPAARDTDSVANSEDRTQSHLVGDAGRDASVAAHRWPPDGSNPQARDAARARRYATVFASLPRDRLLVETDAPAMPLPECYRTHSLPDLPDGTPVNHPANLGAVYAGLAEILSVPVEVLAAQVAANFERFFGRIGKLSIQTP